MTAPVYILGGAQTDFARHYGRAGLGLADLMGDAVRGALDACQIEADEVDCAHVGNFVGELFCGQGLLGGLLVGVDPAFTGIPTARHEAACASGSVAALAASAEIEAGRYDLALVVGVEQMRHTDAKTAARHLGAAAWAGHEATDADYLWPCLFAQIAEEIDARHGLNDAHLRAIAKQNFANAKRNPLAQARSWTLDDASFSDDDDANPRVEGRLRKQDCGRITDGAAAVLLASERFAAVWAAHRHRGLADIPRILGWGHRTAPLSLDAKLAASAGRPLLFPQIRAAAADAWRRAGIRGVTDVDGLEVHDCFSVTQYMLIDHLGITPPGEAWRAIEDGTIAPGGALPMNPSGGLIGLGHPVGATGVRMLLDAANQVTLNAGACQVPGAKRFQTLNLGGSATTTVSFVVGC